MDFSSGYWADVIAREVIRRNPDKEEYVCAAGISPSGSIHIGNFRDVATSYFVAQALRKAGKKARLLFSWDELDRLRKVPKNVAAVAPAGFEENIGRSYVDIANPFPDDPESRTYAEHFEKEFEESIRCFKLDMDFRHQAEMYRSGKYADRVLFAISKRKEIFDILDRHRTQDSTEEERENYYPVSIYCPCCGRDTTKIQSLSEDGTVARYTCSCGHSGEFDFKKDFNCKLAWKVDWVMRWQYEGVDFEPGGIDHASPHGSYDTSKDIAKEVFGFTPPLFQGYGFIGIKGLASKMSGSSGLNLTPASLLRIYQPEVLLWLYARVEPNREFDFCLDDGILRQYFEFDRMLKEVREGKAPDFANAVISYCEIPGRYVHPVPFNLLVQLGSVVDYNIDILQFVLEKIGQPFTEEELAERLELAKNWLRECSPESVNTLRKTRNWAYYETLDEVEKQEIDRLHANLKQMPETLEDLQAMLYAVPREVRGITREDKSLKAVQTRFFNHVYQLLIDKQTGPRLYLFLFGIDQSAYMNLLDFSYPRTPEEMDVPVPEETEAAPEEAPAEADAEAFPVPAVKPAVPIDLFDQMDLRVCKVVKCQEIRKSQNCYKITLDDGIGKRVIVSSIKPYYTPEELVGKKIIVFVNLEPKRIAGVTSEGMLLAYTFGNTCKVAFVDDLVPVGVPVK